MAVTQTTGAAATPPAAPGEPGWRAARRLLRGSLRTLVTGQCLGQAADGLAQIAFAQFIVFEVGQGATPARIASLLAVTLLPFSLVGPFAGVVIDRWPRRRVLVVMSLLRTVLTLAAVVTVVNRWEAAAYVGVLLLLSTSRFVMAAKGASLPRTVPANELVTANAISSVAGMSAAFLGAVAGAAFVARSAPAGFVVAAILYLTAAAAFARLPDVGGGGRRDVLRRLRQVLVDVKEGLVAVGDPEVGLPLAAVWLHRLLLGGGFVLLVLVADSRFSLGISGYGLALAVTGVAAFVGTVAAPVAARKWSPKALLPLAFLPPAAAVYAGGLAPNLYVLVAGVGVTAMSFQLLKVLVDALVGRASADVVRGRVFSVYDVLYNVAFVLAGLLMIPLWDPDLVRDLLWWLAAAFLVAWLVFARLFRGWPFQRPGVGVRELLLGFRDAETHDTETEDTETEEAVRPARRWRGRMAAFACGALPFLAFPEPGWWWFAWVALVPLLLLLRSTPTAREAAVRGWWAGAGYTVAADHWLVGVAGPVLLLLALILGALWVPWAWVAHRMLTGRPSLGRLLAATLVLPAAWVAMEAVRSWQSLGGPWALLGASQWNRPETLASAALGGVWLTSFLLVAVNVAVVGCLTVDRAAARAGLALVAVAAVAVGPAWAALRPAPAENGVVRVAVVQPGVLGGPAPRLARGIALTDGVADQDPDLVVWGESSVGYDLETHPALTARLTDLARRTGAAVLVNEDAEREGGGIFKTSVLVTATGVDGRYVKTRLVPFGEYIPLRPVLGWVAQVSRAAAVDRGRGEGPVVLDAGLVRVGPLICFESTFPDMARREVALGAELVVYQTSNSTFQGTWAQAQHASLSAVRAVETGRPVVHAALTGTTAAYDATGNRLLWIDPGERGAEVLTLSLTSGRTPYDVAGDWVLVLAAVVIASALVAASLREAAAEDSGSAHGDPPALDPLGVQVDLGGLGGEEDAERRKGERRHDVERHHQ